MHVVQPYITNEALVTESWRYNRYISCRRNAPSTQFKKPGHGGTTSTSGAQ